MRILYQLTSPMEKTALGPAEVARRRQFLAARASAGVDIDVRSLVDGPASIESEYEAAIVVPELTRAVRRAQADGFHAVIVGCFSDPGLDALRELVTIPVIGPGAASVHVAAQLGTRFTIVSSLDARSGAMRTRMRALGLDAKLASVRALGMAVLDVARERDAVLERLTEIGRAALREDHADVLVLGCLSMGFLGITDELGKRLEVPVVNPVLAALKTAEMMVAMGVTHSKVAYPAPPKLEVPR